VAPMLHSPPAPNWEPDSGSGEHGRWTSSLAKAARRFLQMYLDGVSVLERNPRRLTSNFIVSVVGERQRLGGVFDIKTGARTAITTNSEHEGQLCGESRVQAFRQL